MASLGDPGPSCQSGHNAHPPVSLPPGTPSAFHICVHFPRPWDVTLRSHMQSILSMNPHLINRYLRIYCRPSYRASSEALLILIGSHTRIEYAHHLFTKSLLERGWAVRRPRDSDESKNLQGYTNIYLVQQYTQRAVLGSTGMQSQSKPNLYASDKDTAGRVSRFTATGSLATAPIVEDYTPVSQSTDEDWLARGRALIEEERRKESVSSSFTNHPSPGLAKAGSSPIRADRPAMELQPTPYQA